MVRHVCFSNERNVVFHGHILSIKTYKKVLIASVTYIGPRVMQRMAQSDACRGWPRVMQRIAQSDAEDASLQFLTQII